MRIHKEHYVVCDQCGFADPGATANPTPEGARKQAFCYGWGRFRFGKRWLDLCPDCIQRRSQQEAEAVAKEKLAPAFKAIAREVEA